jgi:type II secretory pathway pseudopilin PulG
MKSKNDGFTLIELIAILFITSAIIVPLMSSLIGNIEINERTQQRRNATSVADGVIYGLDKLSFSDFRTEIDTSGNDYLIFNLDSCNTVLTGSGDQAICDAVFQSSWNNLTLTADNVEVYMFNYALDPTLYQTITGAGSPFDASAAQHILNDEEITCNVIGDPYNCKAIDNTVNEPDLIRVVIWVDYYDDPDQYVLLTGLIINDN